MKANKKHFSFNNVYYSLKKGWRIRNVCLFSANARTKERFVRTKLGSFWIGLSNLLSISLLSFVYGTVFKVQDISEYTLYLGIGMVIWNSLSTTISASPNLLIQNEQKIKNMNTDPIFYSLEEWIFQVQSLFQSFSLVLIVLAFFKFSILINTIIFGLLPLINLLLFMFWFPLITCLLGAKFRDIYQLVPILLQLIFLLSPILYMKENLGSLTWIINLNPFYLHIDLIREAVVYGNLEILKTLILLFFNILGLYLSIGILNKEKKFLPFII